MPQEHKGIITPNNSITNTAQARCLDAKDLIEGIRNKKGH